MRSSHCFTPKNTSWQRLSRPEMMDDVYKMPDIWTREIYLVGVEPTHLKNISQHGNLPQFSGWKKNELPPPSLLLVFTTSTYYVNCFC